MTDLDVSLRLRLDNQLSRPAETAEKDLKELQKTIDRIGKSKGGDGLASDLKSAGRSANDATRDIEAMKRQLGNVNSASDGARRSIDQLGTAASNARREINRIGDGAFDGLKADAKAAGDAIDNLGRKTRELNNIPHPNRGIQPSGHLPNGPMSTPRGKLGTTISSVAEAAADTLGVDGYVVLGSGAAYAAGSAAAGGLLVAGTTFKAAANAEYRSDQLAVTGGYSPEKQAEIDRILRTSGANRGVGEGGAQSAFGKLLAGGLSPDDAAAITDPALVFSKATESDPEEVGSMVVAMKDNMKISNADVSKAFDMVAFGANLGKFEPKAMARYFPELLAGAQMHNSTGLEGISLIVAAAQSVVKKSASEAEASTKMKNLFNDLNSKGITDNLKEYGVDVFATEAQAKKDGKSPLMAVFDQIHKQIGTDPEKLGKIFTNDEGKTAITAILQELPQIKKMIADMQGISGYTHQSYDRATGNVNSQADRFFSHVAKGAKSVAEPALPYAEAGLRGLNEIIEADPAENQKKVLLASSPVPFLLKNVNISKWLFGAAAEPGFSFKEHMAIDLRPTGEEAMVGLNEGIQAQQGPVLAQAQSIADQIKAMFGFTVSPTIQPTFIPPNGGGGWGGDPNGGKVTVNNHITTPNAGAAARKAVREQNRKIQGAKARSLSSTGRPIQ